MPDATITPETQVAELLERWPALEPVLVSISPHFEALRHPVLRRTVAKVATLRHAAQVSGVPLVDLVTRLREAAGLAPLAVEQVFELVRRIRAERFTVLIVEQNVQQVLEVVDRAYLLEVGRIRFTGAAAELKDNEFIRKAYMGL
jgi:ABC-type thiamine transport system ATPase subunit